MSEFKGTKEEKAAEYAKGKSSFGVFVENHRRDYLAGYNQALEDSKADNMLYLLELIAYDEIYHVSSAVKEHAKQVIKEVTIL